MPWTGTPEQWTILLTIATTIIGGIWVLYTAWLKRSFESGLAIDVTVGSLPSSGNTHLVTLDVQLRNTGNRRVRALRRRPNPAQYDQSIVYGADLHLKQVTAGLPAPSYLDWWASAGLTDVFTPPHLSLLHEYYEDKKTEVDFFMEPGEECVLLSSFILKEGHYLAKIVFVGEREGAAEYWSRVVLVPVPAPAPADSASTATPRTPPREA
jgi:hypothetical protein